MWLFIGGIFLFTVIWSWYEFDGDVSHERLIALIGKLSGALLGTRDDVYRRTRFTPSFSYSLS